MWGVGSMGSDLIIAIVSGVVSFLIFLLLLSLLKRAFNIDMPGWLIFVLGIIIVFVLYYKKEFFFGSPIAMGATIGFILSLLWNIRETAFLSGVLKGIFSFKFVWWAAITALGIFKRDIIVDLWNKYIIAGMPSGKQYLLITSLIIYIIGSIFILCPGVLTRKRRGRSSGFSMNRKSASSKIVFAEILGTILALLGSTLIIETYTNVISKWFS